MKLPTEEVEAGGLPGCRRGSPLGDRRPERLRDLPLDGERDDVVRAAACEDEQVVVRRCIRPSAPLVPRARESDETIKRYPAGDRGDVGDGTVISLGLLSSQ